MHMLGPLEAKVMDVLWDDPHGELRVQDVLQRLAAPRPPAYTTVKTVLDNLHRKGWAARDRDRRGYRYQPTATREAVAAQAVCALARSVRDIDMLLADLVRHASPDEIAAMRRALTTIPDGG